MPRLSRRIRLSAPTTVVAESLATHAPTRARLRELPYAARLAFSAAMLAAAAQLLRHGYIHFIRDSFAWASRDAPWMTPLSFLAIFGTVAVLQLLVGTVVRQAASPTALAWTLTAICTFSVLLNLRSVAPVASLVLALGVASVVAPRLNQSRVKQLAAVAGMLAVGMAVLGAGERARRSGQVGLGAVPPSSAPNVLLIIWDTVRAANTTVYGYGRETTPFLSELAREGAVFEHASAPSSWTLPSHVAFFTGRRAGVTGVDWSQPYDGRYATLAEAFHDRGYSTAAFAANISYATWESGLHRGFDVFDDYPVTLKQLVWSANLMQLLMVRQLQQARSLAALAAAVRRFELRMPSEPMRDQLSAEDVVGRFLAWFRGNQGRPFFAFLNLFDAHEPFVHPRAYREKYGDRTIDTYDGAIRYMDDQLRVLLDSLRARGALDRTIVVVTSDHGEQFGERGLRSHGNSLYAQLTQVPLVVRYPRRLSRGLRIRQEVSLTNLPATVADLAELPSGTFPGQSFAPDRTGFLGSAEPVFMEVGRAGFVLGTPAPNAAGPMYSVIDFPWHYIRDSDDAEHLFDLGGDPAETLDLAGEVEHRQELLLLRALVDSVLGTPADGFSASPEPIVRKSKR